MTGIPKSGEHIRSEVWEKSNRKRMSTVAAVYTVARNKRTPEEILNVAQDDEKKPRPKPKNKHVGEFGEGSRSGDRRYDRRGEGAGPESRTAMVKFL